MCFKCNRETKSGTCILQAMDKISRTSQWTTTKCRVSVIKLGEDQRVGKLYAQGHINIFSDAMQYHKAKEAIIKIIYYDYLNS